MGTGEYLIDDWYTGVLSIYIDPRGRDVAVETGKL